MIRVRVIAVAHFTVTVTHFTVTVTCCRYNVIRVMRAFSVDLPPRPHEVGHKRYTFYRNRYTFYRNRCTLPLQRDPRHARLQRRSASSAA